MTRALDSFPLRLPLGPETRAAAEELADALAWLQQSKLCFATRSDAGSDQIWLYTDDDAVMEQLVLSLLKERNIAMQVGAPAIAYRAAIRAPAQVRLVEEAKDKGARHAVELCIAVTPEAQERPGHVAFAEGLSALKPDLLSRLKVALTAVLQKSPLERFPLYGVRAEVRQIRAETPDVTVEAVLTAAKKGLRRCLRQAGLVILEPIMRVEAHVPERATAGIIRDIQQRRGRVLSQTGGDGTLLIMAEVPMANLLGYINVLRAMTDGTGRFQSELSHFREVPTPHGPDDAPPFAMAL